MCILNKLYCYISSRGRLCDPVFRFILPDTAVKSVSRQAHSPHKVTPCDTLGLPFPIKLTEPRPVDLNGLPAVYLPDALAISMPSRCRCSLNLFKASCITHQLRECCKHVQHEFARRSISVDVLLVADKGNTFVGEGVDDVQQVLCGAS